jgi:putative salt-induced outer membrane protein
MQIKQLMGISAAFLLGISQPVMSQDDEEEEKEGWSGKGEFGYVQTSGNTDTSTLNMGLAFAYNRDKWRHHLGATALRSEQDDELDAERYTFDAQSDYKFSEKDYAFGAFRYVSDEFAPFDPVSTLSFGYGRELIKTKRNYLLGEIGVGYRVQDEAVSGMSEDGAILRGRLDYKWTISESTEFANLFLVEAGSDNTYVQNDTSIAVAINSRFALKAAFQVRYNSDPPPETLDDTDTQFTTNLVYNF